MDRPRLKSILSLMPSWYRIKLSTLYFTKEPSPNSKLKRKLFSWALPSFFRSSQRVLLRLAIRQTLDPVRALRLRPWQPIFCSSLSRHPQSHSNRPTSGYSQYPCSILLKAFFCLNSIPSRHYAEAQSASNAPFVAYHLADQRPPVARVGELFSWSFLPGTFNTSSGTTGMFFTASNLPVWATFDSSTQEISGTPNISHLGTTNVRITASSASNSSSVSDSFRLLVATGPPPKVNRPFDTQLGNGSVLGSAKFDHATKGISVPPNWSWSLGLLPDTFVVNNSDTIYYTAYQLGTTSLPNWIKFNTVTATFDGVTPNEEQDIWIVVYGSDYFGYGDVKQIFRFTVTQHLLDLIDPLPAINATVKSIVDYTIPFDGFTIDGITKNSSSVFRVNLDLSQAPYLTYDEKHFSITGTLPDSLEAFTNLTIPVSFFASGCHNNVSTEINLRVVPGLFTAPILTPFYIHPNEDFRLNLSQYTSNVNATYSLGSVSPKEAQEWLQFSSNPLSLFGKAPPNDGPSSQSVTIDLEASGLNGMKSSAKLPVILAQTIIGPKKRSSHGLTYTGKMVLAIVFGCVLGVVLLILMMRVCRSNFSEDGFREREEKDKIYQSYYHYTDHKSGRLDASGNSNKSTPLSAGATLIDPRSPRWESKAGFGGPMMAITSTELAAGSDIGVPYVGFKRLDIFKVFARPTRIDPALLPTHSSARGLGILAPKPRLTAVATEFSGTPHRIKVVARNQHSDDSHSTVADIRVQPATSSEGRRSSWNTSRSSSLFYSDSQGAESDVGSTSGSETKSRGQASTVSIPRRREEYRARKLAELQASQQFSSGSKGTVDIGTIRMVVNSDSVSEIDLLSLEEDPIVSSESMGAIKTACLRKIATESSASVVAMSETDSGSSHRPKLIPFQNKKSQNAKNSGSRSGTPPPSTSTQVMSGPSRGFLEAPIVEHDAGAGRRSSAQSAPYSFVASGSNSGSPTRSAIFFSPSGELALEASRGKSSLLPKSFLKSHNRDTSSSLRNERKSEADSSLAQPIFVRVGVGEPFHITPSIVPRSAQTSNDSELSENAALGSSRYCALTDYPNEPDKDKKQLPEWIHFDARDQEIWGIPRKLDVGLMSIQIIERRSNLTGASRQLELVTPLKRDRPNEIEEVVSRFVLEVVDKASSSNPSHGNVSVVTF
ncbi:hypothetical protein O181_011965 [Austropuccinia psidii MF-1]|uniref:Dystroglycan-type cadherin-like domain-containing protein n=1 Tax=Austropuccinia psidii MF-1 TaxID=1389203 RepID=A0A9Q3BW60_9BASI|nr:hypothetical protein [Austropuccinia psidii MF-1]